MDISGMSLLQCLNALEVIDRRLVEAQQDRLDFMQEWAMRHDATENGALMARVWVEDSLKAIKADLRYMIDDKFEPKGS